jgi:hypothetical protein
MSPTMRPASILTGLCAGLCAAGLAAAAGPNWYDTIVPEKSHDFGTVARGSKVRHAFRVVNTTSHDVRIADFRTKCGCTDVKIGSREVPPGTQTTVEVTLDTTRFVGYKPSGLTLVFDRPQFVEVDLNLSSFIRGDLMLSEGGFDFGAVPRGKPRTHTLQLTYQGTRPDWAITKLNTITEHVQATLKAVGRTTSGARRYELTATVQPSAPAGYLREEITLSTNDPESPTIPVSLTAAVQPAVTVAPAVLNLGHLKPGQEVQKVVMVKGPQPFRVTGASSLRPEVSATRAESDAKPFHTLTVTLRAPATAGPYNAVLEIATDLKDEPPARVSAFALVTP